ncbi:substrate-binding domain-containing protein [Streptomyces indicus]|uniref:DNA-binding transcriptional regulator, LacI/PurR family n=1 Tax=Streptomyces indicus TaxID=417292 RepID=A0A1G8V1P6_9ACTN|nr:substrate-binding domain-containing protein [Streptomyces indicus]SDJ59784.1 DNA-binding transcriptional regulator, LacI/PurR family [Streptomyces indicus]
MRLHVDQRHERVLELVRERGSIRVAELAQALGVSPVTLRRDVETLAAQGKIQRMHGAVVWPGGAAEQAPRQAAAADAEGLVIGLVVPTNNYYYPEVVRGVREVVEAHGARITIGITNYLPGEDVEQAKRLIAAGVDGLLITPTWDEGAPRGTEGAWVADFGVPTVLMERWAPHGHPAAALDRVRSDHGHGAAEAVRHLVSLGHRSVGLVLRNSPTARHLKFGHAAAVEALGLDRLPDLPFEQESALHHGEHFDRAFGYLCELIDDHGVTAALIHSDTDALTLIPRLQARGIRVPEDLAVVAYDDEVAGLADQPLTAVGPAKREVGARAAELLLARLTADPGADPGPRQHIDLLPELRVRASCGSRLERASSEDEAGGKG